MTVKPYVVDKHIRMWQMNVYYKVLICKKVKKKKKSIK